MTRVSVRTYTAKKWFDKFRPISATSPNREATPLETTITLLDPSIASKSIRTVAWVSLGDSSPILLVRRKHRRAE